MEVPQVTIKQENVDNFTPATDPTVNYEIKIPDSRAIKVEPVEIDPCPKVYELTNLKKEQHFSDEDKGTVDNDSNLLDCLQLKPDLDPQENSGTKFKIKCEFCEFKTDHNDILKSHMATHEKPEEVDMHQHNQSDYQTSYESYLNDQLSKNPEPEFLIKCDQCDYKTLHMSKMRRHIRKHDSSKCNQCSYQTYNKNNLRQHILKHKEVAKMDLYICEQCTYQTRYHKCWKRHLLNFHKKNVEI